MTWMEPVHDADVDMVTATMDILAISTEIDILGQEMAAIVTTDPARWHELQREVIDLTQQWSAMHLTRNGYMAR